LLTCYDLEALQFPRVAPRAVLPEMFWKPKDECGWRVVDGFITRAGEDAGKIKGVPKKKKERAGR
jgi:hypothetical protein